MCGFTFLFCNFAQKSKIMHQEEVSIQSLINSDSVTVSYSGNDLVIIDDIQEFAAFGAAHLSLNGIAVCTSGKVSGSMNGKSIEITKNQVVIIPKNVIITDIMFSPDFKLKAMFLADEVLQSFLREKISIWNETMYIYRNNVFTLEDDDVMFYEHFYSMLKLILERGKGRLYHHEIVESLLRTAMLGLCSELKQRYLDSSTEIAKTVRSSPSVYFQKFLDLLNSDTVRRSVEFYARQLCITPKYLSWVCKSISGKTALEWITAQMLEKIRYYLTDTDLTIKEICEILAFPNPSFFGKYVKEHFGTTPAKLRGNKGK